MLLLAKVRRWWREIALFIMALLVCDLLIYYYGYGRFTVSATVQVTSHNTKSRGCPYSSGSPCLSVSYEGYVVESDVVSSFKAPVSVLIERHVMGIMYQPPNWPAEKLEKYLARDYPIGSQHVAYFTSMYENGRSSISSPVNGILIFNLIILVFAAGGFSGVRPDTIPPHPHAN